MRIYYDKAFRLQELMQYAAPSVIRVGNNLRIDLHSTNVLNFMMLEPIGESVEELLGVELNCIEYDPTASVELLEFRDLIELDEKNFEKFKVANVIARYVKNQKSSNEPRFLKVENSLYGVEVVLSVDQKFLLSHAEFFAHKGFTFLLDCIIASILGQLMKNEPVKILSTEPLMYRLDLENITGEKAEELGQRFSEVNTKMVDIIDGMFILLRGIAEKFNDSVLEKHRESIVAVLSEGFELDRYISELQMLNGALKSLKI
ncbi:hypothetical protein QQE94_08040 [Fervidobacterium pennivorans subsp. shakshaketiis]|uniref:hypothetical protein n=1 Tax=Fervidobacterium TaxID=2422 RepID=UPI001436C4F6|nr:MULTISPECIES: hypothetical protein [Fervidobacterium]NPU89321.1 hypothetical protein [Fervidobacterium sp.]QIV78635.1 hypothetical protein HER11_06620 [Fervidobacterium pennivorans subsp. keratinolyticus]